MRPLILISLGLCFAGLPARTQTFYDAIGMGDYAVGYSDTLLYDTRQEYAQFDYSGPAPLFIHIWHPLVEEISVPYLTYGDFRKPELPENLQGVFDQLNAHMDTSFILYNVSESFDTFEPIDYTPHSYEDVLRTIKTCETRSVRTPINPENQFPVILYHHGSQGLSDENFVMAEYFASHGYIVVSANYHLPFDGLPYGFTRGSWSETERAKRVSEFATALTRNDHLFYIGHSWGAQVGFRYLYEKGWADGFVSMETTIERKTDSLEIMDKWPQVYNIIGVQHKKYPLPVLLFGRNGENQPFPFFQNISDSQPVLYASTKKDFGHESYTSAYLLRYFYRHQYRQPDSGKLKSQVMLYSRHLDLIRSFFESILQNRPANTPSFEKYFYFH